MYVIIFYLGRLNTNDLTVSFRDEYTVLYLLYMLRCVFFIGDC